MKNSQVPETLRSLYGSFQKDFLRIMTSVRHTSCFASGQIISIIITNILRVAARLLGVTHVYMTKQVAHLVAEIRTKPTSQNFGNVLRFSYGHLFSDI